MPATAARAAWKSFVRFGLVSVPVRAYAAAESGGGGGAVSFNQLHAECHSRIQYKKSCPLHGEVPPREVVKGYEFERGRYVVVDPAELEALRSPAERALNVVGFVDRDAVDAVYLSGKSYYLELLKIPV